MDLDHFLQFLACLLFAWFCLYWQNRFTYPKFRWVAFVLVCLGVIGALILLAIAFYGKV